MSSDPHRNSDNTAAGGGYTPAPVKKTRTVTGSHIPQLTDQPDQQQLPVQTVSSQQSASYNEHSRPSIQLNLNTIDQAAQTVLEKEAEAQNRLATFSPLSSTPIEYQKVDPNHYEAQVNSNQFGAQQDPWQNVVPDSLTPDPYYRSSSSELPDLYKSRRRSLMFLSLLFALSVWFIAMAIQVGVARLMKDPYGETLKAITGSDHSTENLELRAPAVQNTIIIEEGRAVAKVILAQVIDQKHVAIQGVLLNDSTSIIESALLKLTLRQAADAKKAWAQVYEFACCEKLDLNQLSPSEIEEKTQRTNAQLLQADGDLELNEGSSRPFTFIAKIKDKKVRLKTTDTLQVDIEVTFFE